MFGSNLDGPVEIGTLEKVKAADPFPCLGERAVGHQHLALAPTDGHGVVHALETAAEKPHLPSVHLLDPIAYVVFLRRVFLPFGVDADEHHVAHRTSSFHRLVERERVKSTLTPGRDLIRGLGLKRTSQDRTTVFDQREHISLHVLAELSRLRKASPLEETPAIAVVPLHLDRIVVATT